MREHIGPVVDLRGAVLARRLLWFFCRWCGHAERCDPRDLAFKLAPDVRFDALAPRLRCRRCNTPGRASIIVADQRFLDRNA